MAGPLPSGGKSKLSVSMGKEAQKKREKVLKRNILDCPPPKKSMLCLNWEGMEDDS